MDGVVGAGVATTSPSGLNQLGDPQLSQRELELGDLIDLSAGLLSDLAPQLLAKIPGPRDGLRVFVHHGRYRLTGVAVDQQARAAEASQVVQSGNHCLERLDRIVDVR